MSDQTSPVAGPEKIKADLQTALNNSIKSQKELDPQSEPRAFIRSIEQRDSAYENAFIALKNPPAAEKLADGSLSFEKRNAALANRDIDPVSKDVAQAWAQADIEAYKKLAESVDQRDAAVAIANNKRNSAAYKESLLTQDPTLAQTVDELDKKNTDAMWAKEARKSPAIAAAIADKGADAPQLVIDERTQANLAATRARDREMAEKALGLNSVERDTSKKVEPTMGKGSGNQVESDEIFTARQNAVPAEVEKTFKRVGDKFYRVDKPSEVAFVDQGNRLETRSNGEQVAATMVQVALSRGWDEIKVSGSETFRREAWQEAAARGMQVKGYTPTKQDLEELSKRGTIENVAEATKNNPDFRVREKDAGQGAQTPEQARAKAFREQSPVQAAKQHPELAGTYAAVAAMDRQVESSSYTPAQQAKIKTLVRDRVANSIERGDTPAVNIREERTAEQNRTNEPQREMTR